MSRKILALLLVLFLFSGVFAIRQIEPYSKTIEEEDNLGFAVPDSVFRLVFSKENEKFDSLNITSSLPEGFSLAVYNELESFIVMIVIPKEAENDSYKINLEFSNSSNALSTEELKLYFVVDFELLFASMDNFSQETLTGEDAIYSFTLINNSDARANFKITSSLPVSWSGTLGTQLLPKSIVKEEMHIFPGISGERDFTFTIEYAGKEKEFNAVIIANPTLESKFASVLSGLPFYSFSLIPSYLLNGLFALLF